MENSQFKSDSDEFECIQCSNKIKIENTDTEIARTVTCSRCATEYDVLARTSGPGLEILVKTRTEPEQSEMEEAELEDEDVENPKD